MTTQLDRIEALLRQHIDSSVDWRVKTDEALARNTEVTEKVREVVGAGRVLKWVLVTLGTIAGAIAGFWTLAASIGGQNGG